MIGTVAAGRLGVSECHGLEIWPSSMEMSCECPRLRLTEPDNISPKICLYWFYRLILLHDVGYTKHIIKVNVTCFFLRFECGI